MSEMSDVNKVILSFQPPLPASLVKAEIEDLVDSYQGMWDANYCPPLVGCLSKRRDSKSVL